MSDETAPVTDTATTTETITQPPADWRSSLPEDIRDNPTLAKYKDPVALAAAHINLQSHLGRDKIAKPKTDSDWNDVYNFLGRPESADKYELALPEGVPDAIKGSFNDDAMKGFREKAHALGLNANQVKELFGWYVGNTSQQFSAMQENAGKTMSEAEASLKQEWGRAYEQNLKFARKAFAEYGGDELAEIMEKSGMGNNPAVLKAFAKIAKTTMPDKDLVGTTESAGRALTPDEAKAEAKGLMSHPAYMDKRHPEHKMMVRKVQNLFEQAF
jgi:hypothetical protein